MKRLEKEGVTFAEMSRTDEAMQCFDQAIALLPNRASAYNNRAQMKRITGDVEGMVYSFYVYVFNTVSKELMKFLLLF